MQYSHSATSGSQSNLSLSFLNLIIMKKMLLLSAQISCKFWTFSNYKILETLPSSKLNLKRSSRDKF